MAASPRQYQRIMSKLGAHILKRVQKRAIRMLKGLKSTFYNKHTKTYTLISLSERRLRGELIQIENKELSKSRVVDMPSVRLKKVIIKIKKKAVKLATLWKYSKEEK